MNWKIVFAIANKDLYEARQNKSVWLPIMIVPLFFILVLPLAMILTLSNPELASSMTSDPDIIKVMEKLPDFLSQIIAGLDLTQASLVLMLGYLFAPFFLILPIMFSTVIASESFAGEKERKTIEALLYSPATDTELFLGKVLSAFIPAVVITWISFLAYTIVLNAAAYPIMGRLWFPLVNWYPLIFWVSPALSMLGIGATVLISSKVQTFMGAYQSSASLVLVVIALLVGQITGVLYLSPLIGILLGFVIWIADGILSWLAVKSFNRDKLLMSEK